MKSSFCLDFRAMMNGGEWSLEPQFENLVCHICYETVLLLEGINAILSFIALFYFVNSREVWFYSKQHGYGHMILIGCRILIRNGVDILDTNFKKMHLCICKNYKHPSFPFS